MFLGFLPFFSICYNEHHGAQRKSQMIAITFSSFFPLLITSFEVPQAACFLCEVKNDLLFRMANKLMFIVQQLTTIEYDWMIREDRCT